LSKNLRQILTDTIMQYISANAGMWASEADTYVPGIVQALIVALSAHDTMKLRYGEHNMSIPSFLEEGFSTIHGAISGLLGTNPQPVGGPNGLRPITLADATKLIQAGMTMSQLSALGYVIVA
jgi:hypothetical protein